MNTSRWQIALATAALALLGGFAAPPVLAASIPVSQSPLFTATGQPPLMMMVMSRDEQLFIKAYTDYTDLDGDNLLDTTYQNRFSYSGYFDSDLCYTYGSGQFKASSAASNHRCSGSWSGNFLNWVTMSRLDMLRFVFYGGYRSTDTSTTTVLERAHVPSDLHAWVKTYSGSDIGSYTPYTTATSFCNASFSNTGVPQLRVASGLWTEWASTSQRQCAWKEDANTAAKPDSPSRATELTVRVEVCAPGANTVRESFCRSYGTAGNFKPAGLLQEYGETGSMRFGLLTGSYSAPRSGGVIRRNIGLLSGNGATAGCAANDEIDAATGVFCNQGAAAEGVINTMNRLKLLTWNYSSTWSDCSTYSILNRQGFGSQNLNNPGTAGNAQNCSAWGNPMSEMYAEALRYIAAETPSAAFNVAGDLAGLPAPAWKDPYRSPDQGGSVYCATCSILALSTGLNSFDSDEIPTVAALGTSAAAATNIVGAREQVSGNYLVGRSGATPLGASLNTHEDLCTVKNVGALADVRGICPDIPSMEGSYLLSGLAYKAYTTDLRPSLLAPDGNPKPATYKNKVQTYAVSVAENLPTFKVPIGNGSISLAPLCQANNAGGAAITAAGWRSCYLGAVGIGTKTSTISPNYVYGRALENDGSAGSFSLVWEDSQWGNDHDNDVVSMLTYCVGAKCTKKTAASQTYYDICWRSNSADCGSSGTPAVAADEALVRIENLSAFAGNAMLTGFSVSGSGASDGVKRLALRPGGQDGSVLTATANPPASWTVPQVLKFRVGSSNAKQLENPLFYAAKFGSFKDANSNDLPDRGEWDAQQPGKPDAFFPVRDPARLKSELRKVFEAIIAGSKPSASLATSSPRFVPGATLTYQVSFKADDWSGDVQAFRLNANGTLGTRVWSAAEELPAAANRKLFTAVLNGNRYSGRRFEAAAYPGPQGTALLGDLPAGFTVSGLVDYLRGVQTNEVPNGPYRKRDSLVGDIVLSTPAVVSRRSFGYAVLPDTVAGKPTGAPAYRSFVDAKSTQPVLFVGANDGMLHGLSGTEAGGEELFGYVPAAITRKLHQLAKPSYTHQYYADASPLVGDAFIDGNWAEVLLSSVGIGGRGVYALNVSGLGNTGTFGPGNVLWEFNDTIDPDMGQLAEKPQIALLADGNWSAVFGNGYNSQDQRAILYVRSIGSGASIAKLDTGVGSATDPNGMSGVAAVDSDGDRVADTIYAGDYQGNLWKFVYDSGSWRNPLGSEPLFRAVDKYGHRQPITGGIDVVANPIGGTVVLFGTGRYLGTDDANPARVEADGNPLVNSLYGIWDMGAQATPILPTAATRATLLREQRITGYANGYRTSTQDAVGFRSTYNPSGRLGWYLDLEFMSNGRDLLRSERVLAAPAVILGTVLFNTFRPQGDVCQPGGLNALMELDALSGGASFTEIPPASGAGAPPLAGGTDIGAGAPQGEPSPVVSIQPPPALPSIPCDPNDPSCTFTPPAINSTRCMWTYPNTANKAIQAPIPCGRVSWRQVH